MTSSRKPFREGELSSGVVVNLKPATPAEAPYGTQMLWFCPCGNDRFWYDEKAGLLCDLCFTIQEGYAVPS